MTKRSRPVVAVSTGPLCLLSVGSIVWGNAGTQLPLSQYQAGTEVTTSGLVTNGNFESVAGADPTGWVELTGELQAGAPIRALAPAATVGSFAAQPQNLGVFDTDPDNYDQRPIIFDQTKTYVMSAYLWSFGLPGPAPHDETDFDPGDMAMAELLKLNPDMTVDGTILVTLALERVASDNGDGSNGYFVHSTFPGAMFPNGAVLQVRGDQDTAGVKPEVYGQIDNVAITELASFVAPSASPRWTADADGTWGTGTNWLNATSPNGAGLRAVFARDITADRTITVEGNKTVGAIVFEDNNKYTLDGSATLTLDALAGEAEIHSLEGSHQINTPVHLADNTIINVKPAAGTLKLTGNLTSGAGVNISKTGTGKLEAKNIRANDLAVGEGKIQVTANGGVDGLTVVNTITIPAAGGSLDLTDNDLVVNNGTYTTVQAQVLAGFGNPNVPGITSTTSDGSQILALFDNAQVGASDWLGVPIGGNAVVGKYTYFGDANIDGQVTGDDYTVVDANLNTTPAVGLEWLSGDMNLDGSVTGDDYTVIDANLGLGSGNPLSSSQVGAVPEPASLAAIVAVGAIALGRARRRRGAPRA